MRSLVILATLFLAANAALDKEFLEQFMTKVKSYGEECMKEVNAKKEDVNNLLSHNVPESHEGKCLIFCFHKRFHIQNEDGSFNKEETMKVLEPIKNQDMEFYGKVVDIVNKCSAETPVDDDPCEYSANLAHCAIKEGNTMSLDELLVIEME